MPASQSDHRRLQEQQEWRRKTSFWMPAKSRERECELVAHTLFQTAGLMGRFGSLVTSLRSVCLPTQPSHQGPPLQLMLGSNRMLHQKKHPSRSSFMSRIRSSRA